MSNLTLWDIEKGIAELFDARDEAETAEAQAACDQALAEYFAREVLSVDRIRGAYRHFEALAIAADQEILGMQARKAMFERRCESIKAMTAAVFEANPQLGGKLEGRSGRLLYKGNGGKQALEVLNLATVPDEYCRMVGWISGELWADILHHYGEDLIQADCKLERVVDNERVRKAIESEGGVPGARLLERGKHVEVK